MIHVETYADVNRAIESYAPILIIYAQPDPVAAGLEEVNDLCAQFSVPCALLADLEEPARLAGLLKSAACFVIDAGNDNQLIATVSRLIDTQARVQRSLGQQAELEELQHRYELLLDSARDAIAYIHEGLHVYANRAYLERLRIEDATDLQGISLLEMMNVPDGDFKSILRDLTKGSLPSSPLGVQVNRPDGTSFEGSLLFSPASFNGEPCIQMMLQERDQAAELAEELERLRNTDPLTGIPNRARFASQLTAFLGQEPEVERATSVLYIEPDGLTSAQEDAGLTGVDAYLAALARVVKEYLEDGDECGRISDHGIAVLVRRKSKQQVEAFAKAIQHAFKNVIIESGGRSFSSSCSIGIVQLGQLSKDTQSVVSQARKACAEALEQGDAVVVYRPQLTAVAPAEDESAWVDRIRYALKNEDFYAAHQSIVDLDGEGGQLIENLVVMRGEESDYPFSDFVMVANKHDLAGHIDRSVIPSILRSISDNEESQIISLSTHSVVDPGFPAWLIDHIKIYAVDAHKLILQVPADSAQANLKPVQRLIRELGPVGCRLSISLFGAERRTLQLFEHLQARYIKLHTALTADLQGNSKAQESIRQIVEAAEEHDTVVIADEISDTSNLAILWQCGVKMIAGAFLKETPQVVGQ
ncbi:MAG: EAL domain-containing protein [Xanthomonadales bacterium]|nr:EAL domain-containing protein [Xanthomonadales bacterium]